MSIVQVGHTLITPAGGSGGTSPNKNTAGSNLIVVAATRGVGTAANLSDSVGNTYTQINNNQNAFNVLNLFYKFNPTTNAAHNWIISGANNESAAIAFYSGVDTSGVYDAQNGAGSNGGATTAQPGSITPSLAGALIISAVGNAQGAPGGATLSVNSGMTITDQLPFSPGNYYGIGMADLIQGAAAAINPTWTLSATPADIACAIVAFIPTVAANFLYPKVILF